MGGATLMEQMVNKTGYFHSKDAHLYYKKTGNPSGIPLMMLHGNRQSHRVYRKLVKHFGQKYQIILLDSRGHGKSQFGKKPLSIELLAEDTLGLVEELGFEQVILLGFSDGANVAIAFAGNYPTRAKAVIAVSPNIHLEGLKRGVVYLLKLNMAVFHLLERLRLPVWKEKELTLLMTRFKMPTEDVEKITAPVLILTGKRDMIREEHAHLIGDLIEKGQVEVLGNHDHFSMFRKSKLYADVITQFLDKNHL